MAHTALPVNASPLSAGFSELEVFDTSELKSLQQLLGGERVRVEALRVEAKEAQRKVLRVNCDLDLKRLAKISTWIDTVQKDTRREW